MSAGRGRPPRCPGDVLELIVRLRRDHMTFRDIAHVLNARGIPTPLARSPWTPAHVYNQITSRRGAELLDRLSAVV
ncbi:recombinase family protein [Microbispora sp. NPDC046933]|uniref:recombinase family protein n=1 Tax=Microbispora sp. NPDC046933 TaxID=3155618 RepID=UPI0033EA95D8